MITVLKQTHFITKSLFIGKTTLVLFLLTLLGALIATFFSSMNIGEKGRFFSDILLSFETIILHISALLYAYELRQKEIRGHYLSLLLRSGERSRYLLTLFLATLVINLTLIALFALLNGSAMLLFSLKQNLLYQLLMLYFSASLLSLLLIMISQKVSLINALFYTLILFFLGSALDELLLFSTHQDEMFQTMASLLYYGLPNFSMLDNAALYHYELYKVALYYLVLVAILFILTLKLFQTKVIQLEN